MTTPRSATELKGKTGLWRLVNAARYSKDGFAAAFRTEEAFRQEFLLGVVLIAALFFIPAGLGLKLLGLLLVVFVWVTELLNSGIEAVVDRVGPEIHPLSKKAKDIGSCAVLMSLIAAGVVWAAILWSAFA